MAIISTLQSFFKTFYSRIFLRLPAGVPNDHYHWIVFANHVNLFAIALGAIYSTITIILHLWILVVFDIAFLATYIISFLSKKKYKYFALENWIVTLIICIVRTLLLGWNSGFMYYLLIIVSVGFYAPFIKRKVFFVISGLLFSIIVATYFVTTAVPPYYVLSHFWQHAFFVISLICFSFSLMYIPIVNTHATFVTIKTLSTTLAKNSELERLSKLKDDFLANTSHELRTPLHGISGIAESLCNDPSVQTSPFLRSNLGHIISSARRLSNLVNDILDFSKMRHDDLTISPRPLDIEQITAAVLPNFSTNAAKKGLTLKTGFSADLPKVYADEDRLIQIMFNLIGNAIKFTDHGSITISAHPDNDNKQIVINVTDTGIGIAEQDLATIFDAFEQASSHNGEYRGGTGLGLSITKKLVELHNGTITVSSKLKQGTTFTILLPIVKNIGVYTSDKPQSPLVHHAFINEPDTQIPEPSTTLPVQVSARQRTVLAIDDEPINLQIVRNHLEALGMNVITAQDGLSILDLINKHNPAIVLLDIMMPGVNGYDCCRSIRMHYTIAEMPVVFISAKNRISDLVLGFEAGGNDYVLKPFLREELIARVEGQIRQREAVDAIREIAELKAKLADQLIEEANLRQIQERLTRLLHSVDDGLVVVNDDGEIIFANNIFFNLLGFADETIIAGKDVSCLMHPDARQHNLMKAKLSRQKFTPVVFAHANGSPKELSVKRTSITIGDEQLTVFAMRAPVQLQDSSRMAEWIFTELEKNQERIVELEQISAECIAANKYMIEQLTFNQFKKVDPFILGNRIMTNVIALWKESTGKEKSDFAEQSGLWKVHPDEDGWQRTATLDKYLDFRKMPKFPRWITVIESATFVINETKKRGFNSDRIANINNDMIELERALQGKALACSEN